MLESSIWKILAFILALYLLFVFPLIHALDRQEDITYQLAYNEVNLFVDSVRDRGFISPEMMTGFFSRLQMTGLSYDVQMEHLHKKYIPLYTDPTDPTTFTGEYAIISEGFYSSEINQVLYPSDLTIPEEQRVYKLSQGDTLSVHIVNNTPSLSSALKRFLFLQSGELSKTVVHIGGMVQNEAY